MLEKLKLGIPQYMNSLNCEHRDAPRPFSLFSGFVANLPGGRNRAWGLVVLGGACLLSNPSFAQDEEDEEDIIELDPFTVDVSDDVGYNVGSSVGLIGTSELIRDTPANISVIPQELIEDLQATDMKEALDYSAGVFLEDYQNTTTVNSYQSGEVSPSSAVALGDPFENTIKIRGYSVPNQQRLGFRVGAYLPKYGVNLGGLMDTANTERMEVVRGPQALLYGISVLSGIVNMQPKMPLSRPATEIEVGYGAYDYKRFRIDNTGPLIGDDYLNYRVIGAYKERGTWEDYLLEKTKYAAGQLQWRPFEGTDIFFELQYGERVVEGGGFKFFRSSNSENPDFHNAYDEPFSYGLDFDNSLIIDDERAQGLSDVEVPDTSIVLEGPLFGRTALVQNPDSNYNFESKGPGFRISGPDVETSAKEFDVMLIWKQRILENLHFEFGGYYTSVDKEVFDVHGIEFAEKNGLAWPSATAKFSNYNDPEYDPNDPYGFGTGELFVYFPDDEKILNIRKEVRHAAYWWYRQPTKSESLQLRARLTYSFDTNFWEDRIRITHRFIGGVNLTVDDVDFVNASNLDDLQYGYWRGQDAAEGGDSYFPDQRQSEDPFTYRQSVFDTDVIRYNGETLFTLGRFAPVTFEDQEITTYIMRSGHRNATQWFRGAYGIYNAKFWEDRISLVTGVRHDAYQVREREKVFIADPEFETDRWLLSTNEGAGRPTDVSLGYGTQGYSQDRWISDFSDEFNSKVETDVNRFLGEYPDGLKSYNFDSAQKFTTQMAGISARVTEDLSVFATYSEGIFPNTGLRDGAYVPIPAEQTESLEAGIKFELLKKRLTGTISAFKIKRHNAVWRWENAPNPGGWFGGPDNDLTIEQENISAFNAQAVADGRSPIRYSVAEKYLQYALREAGYERWNVRNATADMRALGVTGATSHTSGDPRGGANTEYRYFFVDYNKMKEVDETMPGGNPLRVALDMARDDALYLPDLVGAGGLDEYFVTLGRSMYWGNSGPDLPSANSGSFTNIHNASGNNARGANVLFEEEGVGFDGQVIANLLADSSWQLIFSFSQQKREVVGSGFKLAEGYALDKNGDYLLDANGDRILMTTEYDLWVKYLGVENFADPRDPTTLLPGSAINGIDLSFVPRTSWSLWNKYTFQEGFLKNLTFGGGVRYYSAVSTTIAIGGSTLEANRYPTPDVPERYVVDLSLGYSWEMWNMDWRFALKIENVFDSDKSERVSVYNEEYFEDPLVRRTQIYHDPREFRMSLVTSF